MALFNYVLLVAIACVGRSAATGHDGRSLAVLVGIDTYQHATALPPLGLAEADVKDVAGALRAGGFDVRLCLPGLTGGRGCSPRHAGDVVREVQAMAKRAGPNDTILFYYSGHGFSDGDGHGYLCAVGTDPSALKTTAVPLADVVATMRESQARRRILILDACRKVVAKDVGVQGRLKIRPLTAAEGTAVLYSTSEGQLSYEPKYGMRDPKNRIVKNGLFTHVLLHGLRGDADDNRDGFVTVRETEKHAAAMFRSDQMGVPQQPVCYVLDARPEDDLLLCRVIREGLETPPARAERPISIEVDPQGQDDAPYEAIALEANSRVAGAVGLGLDRSDWYKIQVTQPGILRVTLKNTGEPPGRVGGVTLHDHTAARLSVSHHNGVPPKSEGQLEPECLQDYRRYYLEVKASDHGVAVPYELITRFQPLVMEDAGEPNDAPERATTLAPSGGASAWIGLRGDVSDVYRVPIEENGKLRVQLTNLMPPGTHHAHIAPLVVTQGGASIAETHHNGAHPGDTADTGLFVVEAGATYEIRVRPQADADAAPYRVVTTFVPLSIPDVGEPGNRSRSGATSLTPGQSVTARVGYGDDREDWWQIESQEAGYVRFSFANLHDTHGERLAHSGLARVVVSNSRRENIHEFHHNGLSVGAQESSPLLPLHAGGRLYALIHGATDTSCAPYRVHCEFVKLSIDPEKVPDGDDAPDKATTLGLEALVERTVGFERDRVDWYKVETQGPGDLFVDLTNLSHQEARRELAHLAPIEVFDGTGKKHLGSSHHNGIGVGLNQGKAKITLDAAGRFLIKVAPSSPLGAAPYRLEVHFESQ